MGKPIECFFYVHADAIKDYKQRMKVEGEKHVEKNKTTFLDFGIWSITNVYLKAVYAYVSVGLGTGQAGLDFEGTGPNMGVKETARAGLGTTDFNIGTEPNPA